MPRPAALLAVLFLAASVDAFAHGSALYAQSTQGTQGTQSSGGRTTYRFPNALFMVVADQPLYCERITMDPAHRRMGVDRMFQYSLPLSGRSGQLGLTDDGVVRYLMVWRDEQVGSIRQRRMATVHFLRNGAVEVGRQSWDEIRTDSTPQRTVLGLQPADGEQALTLARHLASRCHE